METFPEILLVYKREGKFLFASSENELPDVNGLTVFVYLRREQRELVIQKELIRK